MKKITTVIFLCLLCLSFFSCASKKEEPKQDSSTLINDEDLILKWDWVDKVYEEPLPLIPLDEDGNPIPSKN